VSKISRRQFNTMLGAAAATLAVPAGVRAQSKAKLVVIGGGAAGATAARYVAKDAGDKIDVTLITASDTYSTCFFSNLYLGGYRPFSSITHSYDKLASDYGVNVVIGFAMNVDRGAKTNTVAEI